MLENNIVSFEQQGKGVYSFVKVSVALKDQSF